MSFPPNFNESEIDDIKNTVPEATYNTIPVITDSMKSEYITRNTSGVLELDFTTKNANLAVPLDIYYFESGPYTDIINTNFEYFVDIVPDTIFTPILDTREPGFVERFYDNDWVDLLPTGPSVGFLVPSSTKFQIGDTVYVSQDPGAFQPAYTGTWEVINIVENKKDINGISHDAVQTNCPYVTNTPVNGGTITWIQ